MSSRNEAKFEDQTHRSAAHSTASLCPIVQLPLSESPREPLQNSLSRHRGQLIGPPAASAGTSLEHPSKSVAGAVTSICDNRLDPRGHRGSSGGRGEFLYSCESASSCVPPLRVHQTYISGKRTVGRNK